MKNISQEIFENVLTEINTIEDQISTLQIEINTIRRKTSRLQDLISNFLKSPQYVKKNALIVRIVNGYISAGLSINMSILKTAEQLNEPFERCRTIYSIDKNHKRTMQKYAMYYLIYRLKKSGFKTAQIAKICGYSEKYIYDLIKQQKLKQKI